MKTKHTNDQHDAEILRLYARGMSVIALGKHLGITAHKVKMRLCANNVVLRSQICKPFVQYNDDTLLVHIKNYSEVMSWEVQQKTGESLLQVKFANDVVRLKIPKGDWQLKGNFIEAGLEIDVSPTDKHLCKIVDMPAKEIVVLQRVAS